MKNIRLKSAIDQMSIIESTYTPPILEEQRSPYYDKLKMGARLAPRPFWFLDFIYHPVLRINPKSPKVKSTEESRRRAKGKWKNVLLKGVVESEYIFSTLLSKDLLPFGFTKMRPVVIPAQLQKEEFSLLDVEELKGKGHINTANWLKNVEEQWSKYRSSKAEKNFPSVLDRINHLNLLTIQNPSKRYILMYVASGTYIIATVVDKMKVPNFIVNNTIIESKGFVVESKTWFYESNNKEELNYLCSILNSKILSQHVNELQTRGLWGVRDIHRRPFLYNIPTYDPKNAEHLKLSRISMKLHDIVQGLKNTIKGGISTKRRKIQKITVKELKEIDELTKNILSL